MSGLHRAKFAHIFLHICDEKMQNSDRKMQNSDKKAAPNRTNKREKFRTLAEARTNKALDSIRRIGNLANKQTYEFDDDEVRRVLKALRDAVTEVEARFRSPKAKREARFKF